MPGSGHAVCSHGLDTDTADPPTEAIAEIQWCRMVGGCEALTVDLTTHNSWRIAHGIISYKCSLKGYTFKTLKQKGNENHE